MTRPDAASPHEPWWASGSAPDDGLDTSEDPFGTHHGARHGAGRTSDDTDGSSSTDERTSADDVGRLASDAIDLVARLAAAAGRRISARAASNAAHPPPGSFTRPETEDDRPADRTSSGQDGAWRRLAEGIAPHADGEVCDACPVCIGLRAVRQARPDVIAHLSDAAHHVSLALRALADAQAGDQDGLEKIDLDQ